MRTDQRQVRKERLARLALLPVVAQVDLGGGELEVQVDLRRVAAAQGGEIAGVAEQLGQRLHPRGQRLCLSAVRCCSEWTLYWLMPVISDDRPVEQTGALEKQAS